jgi:UDP-N-acetylmuramoyl-tripeptide--D-alanyl-D-alanine ligase
MITLISQAGIDQVWLVGEEFANTDNPYRKFHDVEEVKAAIKAEQPQGYTILIKGSNSTKLHQLPELL